MVGNCNSSVYNMAKEGGGIFMKESTLNTTGIIYFHKNTVPQGFGGGIYAESSSLHFVGMSDLGRILHSIMEVGFMPSVHMSSFMKGALHYFMETQPM